MRPVITVFTFLLFTTVLTVTTSAQQTINKGNYIQKPESVVTDGRYYYIADIGKNLNPADKDGDGVIWKMDKQGKQVGASAFAKGLNAPKGITIANGILFVTDIDRVAGFELATGRKKYDIDFTSAGTAFLNDLAMKDGQTLFVSAMDINKIFIIHLTPQPHFEELVLTNPIKGINGLYYHARQNRLYACSFVMGDVPSGELGFIDLQPSIKQFIHIIDRSGGYDGIALANDSTVVVSDWVAFEKKGIILSVNTITKKVTIINQAPIAGPADFSLTPAEELVIPAMMEGTILKYLITSTKKSIMEKHATAPALKKQSVSASITVNAPAAKVWQALTDPTIIKKYFFGTEAQSDWKVGSPLTFQGEWKGQQYKDKGVILQSKPNQVFQHTYWSSMSGMEDLPENYATITYKLSGNDQQTMLTVTQDKCKDVEEAKQTWHTVLENLKKTVEGS